mmetsp:Transcript_41158/g.65205  ORF Transcript_41158/g.65205 Transcript_41158/m.65205 type:complete len:275 (+) Transcript_41158:601-1425(+)
MDGGLQLQAQALHTLALTIHGGLVLCSLSHHTGFTWHQHHCLGIAAVGHPNFVIIWMLEDTHSRAAADLQRDILLQRLLHQIHLHFFEGVEHRGLDLALFQHGAAGAGRLQEVWQRPGGPLRWPVPRVAVAIEEAENGPTAGQYGNGATVLSDGPISPSLAALGVHRRSAESIQQARSIGTFGKDLPPPHCMSRFFVPRWHLREDMPTAWRPDFVYGSFTCVFQNIAEVALGLEELMHLVHLRQGIRRHGHPHEAFDGHSGPISRGIGGLPTIR